uniref:Vacuolar protein sorting-associated protein 13 DH-like domain-containing protein n=1 Tax=Panagrolaimus sp. ES5 TaxID=591445 RepID=A0AC34FUA1_9BILA
AFYDDRHFSPLMIHLSFSQGGTAAGVVPHDYTKKKDEKGGINIQSEFFHVLLKSVDVSLTKLQDKKDEKGGINIQSEFLNVLLKSVGVSLTKLQDVFKLAFFERRYVSYSNPQLQAEIQSYYTMQFVKQLYVLVFAFDIIGNPYELVRDLSTGLEDIFYQPINGAIQGPEEFAKGPEEFAKGLALGVSSLFGHAICCAAGSRITGILGKGVAALTLDEEYHRKFQEAMNRRPQNQGEGLSRGVKGFYNDLTGIVTKPTEGMKKGGVGGFMKGVNKGLVGAVTRPVSAVVDFASSSLDAVKVTVGGGDASKALRPPRLIPRD